MYRMKRRPVGQGLGVEFTCGYPEFKPRSNLWGLFLESPETFRAHFGWHNFLCIFKTKASRGTKLHSYFYFYSLYNIWKDQRYRINRSEFYEWLFGPETFSGLSRNGPLVRSCFLPVGVLGVLYVSVKFKLWLSVECLWTTVIVKCTSTFYYK